MNYNINITDEKKPGGFTGVESFTVEDADQKIWEATLQEIANILNVNRTYLTLTSAATVNLNTVLNNNAIISLGENVALSLTGLVSGTEGNIVVIQDIANYTLTITPTPYVINGGAGVISLEPGAGSITVLSYSYDGTRLLVNNGLNYTNA